MEHRRQKLDTGGADVDPLFHLRRWVQARPCQRMHLLRKAATVLFAVIWLQASGLEWQARRR
jgi:hypothetical protein